MQYRRVFIPNASFFFTVVTEKRRCLFTSQKIIHVLLMAFSTVRKKYPFKIDAIVIMPDHLHCIWTLPAGDSDYSMRWRLIKTWFTKHCDLLLRTEPNDARVKKNEQSLWQRRYWEHVLQNDLDFKNHVDYIHFNPVKHGLVSSAIDWPYSSFHRYVREGIYPADWGQSDMNFSGIGSE